MAAVPPPVRVCRIDIKRSGVVVDQIKFTYSDKSCWYFGHDGGTTDRRPAIMSEGEYIVRVTHERLDNFNFKCAAAGIEFETNKGRVFEYCPHKADQQLSKQVTFRAQAGHEIVSLHIEHGTLHGVEEIPCHDHERTVVPKKVAVVRRPMLISIPEEEEEEEVDKETASQSFSTHSSQDCGEHVH
jgi:hypothetical protein